MHSSNLHDALLQSARDTLGEVLAPELAERLALQILEQTKPAIEAAVLQFLGFELGVSKSGKSMKARIESGTPIERSSKKRNASVNSDEQSSVDAAPFTFVAGEA